MKDLFISTQSIRGGFGKMSRQGFACMFYGNEKLLSIDNYRNYGNEYSQRVEPVIVIFDGQNSPNEDVVFEGTHTQLIELLKKNNHENNEKNH